MSKRFFFFMYPDEADIRSLLSLAVFCLNPEEKWPAHVTVAGPFPSKPRQTAIFRGRVPAFSLGVGTFFAQGLNTVYLHIGVPNLRRIWRKPDFSGDPVPHLSLYNGEDRGYARDIFYITNEIRPYFSFSVSGLSLISSVSGQHVTTLREQIDIRSIESTKLLTIDQIRALPSDARLELAALALRRCKELRGYKVPEQGIIDKKGESYLNLKAGLG